MTLDEAVERVQAMRNAAYAVRPDVLVLCHGGPISSPDDAQFVLDRCRGIDGFYGASSMERLPADTAVTEHVRRFTKLRLSGGRPASR